MEGSLIFFGIITFVSAITPGINIASYNQSWPPIVDEQYEPSTINNVYVGFVLECAGLCARTDGCKSFLYKQTDKPQENCFNTETPQMYSGKINTALDGLPCVAWTSNHFWRNHTSSFADGSIYAAENYCRDPLQAPNDGFLWCPIGGAEQSAWETCNIPRCMSTNCRLFNYRFVHQTKVKIADDIVFYYN